MSKTPKEIWCRSGLYYEYVDDWSEGSWSPTNDGGVKYVRADRIEELEAQRKKTYEALLSVTRLHDEVEANLAKAMKTVAAAKEMYETAMLTAGGSPVAWSEHVKARNAFSDTLAELTSSVAANNEVKGGKDD